jgi:hypothetical protein
MVNPIGPPPAINTFVAMCLMGPAFCGWGLFARFRQLSTGHHLLYA